MGRINDHLNKLQNINVIIRQQLEIAEAKIPELNRLLSQLAALKLLNDIALLGGVLISREYGAVAGITDSGQVLVAALVLPGGLGACVFDSEQYAMLDEFDGGRTAKLSFQSFDESEPAVRALLLPHVEPLLDRLIHMIRLPKNGSTLE